MVLGCRTHSIENTFYIKVSKPVDDASPVVLGCRTHSIENTFYIKVSKPVDDASPVVLGLKVWISKAEEELAEPIENTFYINGLKGLGINGLKVWISKAEEELAEPDFFFSVLFLALKCGSAKQKKSLLSLLVLKKAAMHSVLHQVPY